MPERVVPGSGDEPAFVYRKHRRKAVLDRIRPADGALITDGGAALLTDEGDTLVVD